MARGDVVSGLASVASWGRLVYQPAAGVEVLITEVALHPAVGTGYYWDIELFDGVVTGVVFRHFQDDAAVYRASQAALRPLRFFLTNARYLRLLNVGLSGVAGYTGIRTK